MKLGRFTGAKLLAALVALSTVMLLSACEAFSSPQNTFAPEGDVAEKQKDLFLLVMWPALVIGVLVGLATIYILIRYRYRQGEPPPHQLHGNTRIELAWTIAPALLLIGLAVPTLQGIFELGRAPKDDALQVEVTAFRFGWRFAYLDQEYALPNGDPTTVSTDLYIPVDREVGFNLEAPDVIHSFWVPKLAGKTDVIPGRTNRMWFKAKEPGEYVGQCAELCGIGHAGMRFTVHAVPEAEFESWIQEQMAGSSPQPSEGEQTPGGDQATPAEQEQQ